MAVRGYEESDRAMSIAKGLEVAPSALIRLLRQHGVVVRKDGVSTEQARQLAKEYEAGATMAELEAKYKLSHSTVYRALHRVGISAREQAPRKHI